MPVASVRRSWMQRIASWSLMVPLLAGAAPASFVLSDRFLATAGVVNNPNAATITI